jgi:hypothetical protein
MAYDQNLTFGDFSFEETQELMGSSIMEDVFNENNNADGPEFSGRQVLNYSSPSSVSPSLDLTPDLNTVPTNIVSTR